MGASRDQIERAIKAENEGDLAAMVSGYGPDAVYVDPSGTEFRGREAIAELYRGFFKTFPDGHRRLERIIEEGEWVVFEGTMTGTNTGPLDLGKGTMPSTGRRVEFPFVGVCQIVDGQAQYVRMYLDQLIVMQQLGLLPPPAAVGERG